MEELISLYLFRYKKCPLPSIGSLQLLDGHATVLHAEKTIEPPVPYIEFRQAEIPADNFIHFIALQKSIPVADAGNKLAAFCKGLENLDAYKEVKLPYAGKFYVDAEGNLIFRQIEIPETFLPVVTAERLIHPDVAHTMRVGDKETTTVVMTELYSDTGPIKKDRWWIWATILTLLAVAALFIYFNDVSRSSSFGNAAKIVPVSEGQTYKTAN